MNRFNHRHGNIEIDLNRKGKVEANCWRKLSCKEFLELRFTEAWRNKLKDWKSSETYKKIFFNEQNFEVFIKPLKCWKVWELLFQVKDWKPSKIFNVEKLWDFWNPWNLESFENWQKRHLLELKNICVFKLFWAFQVDISLVNENWKLISIQKLSKSWKF